MLLSCGAAAAAEAAPPELVRAAELLPPSADFPIVRQSAVCAFAPELRHLDRLPTTQPWTRPVAIVLFGGLPGQPPGTRAVVMRPTREVLARRVVAEALTAGEAQLLDRELSPVAAGSGAAARHAVYLALFVSPPADPGVTASCTVLGQHP